VSGFFPEENTSGFQAGRLLARARLSLVSAKLMLLEWLQLQPEGTKSDVVAERGIVSILRSQ